MFNPFARGSPLVRSLLALVVVMLTVMIPFRSASAAQPSSGVTAVVEKVDAIFGAGFTADMSDTNALIVAEIVRTEFRHVADFRTAVADDASRSEQKTTGRAASPPDPMYAARSGRYERTATPQDFVIVQSTGARSRM